jgi:hypothetical protein
MCVSSQDVSFPSHTSMPKHFAQHILQSYSVIVLHGDCDRICAAPPALSPTKARGFLV